MKLMELLPVDEYYQTVSTWFKIMEDKNKAAGGGEKSKGGDGDGTTRRKLTAKR